MPPGWSEWRALLEPSAQDDFDYDLNEDGVVTHYGTAPEDYKTRVLGDLAVDAIRHAARGDRPLFLYVGFNAPHAPSTPAPRDAGSLEGASAPRTPAFDEDDLSDKPRFLRDRPSLSAKAIARIDGRHQRALESLAEVDRQVAKIVDALRDKEELGETYIVFTSDNGYLDGEHRIELGKGLAYEPASQVPLLIRGPGIPAGETSEALVGNVDLAPTIAAIAEAEPTAEFDGESLLQPRALPRELDRPGAPHRVAGPRPLDRLRLPIRGGPQRPLPLRRVRDRRRGALQPGQRPRPARVARRRPRVRRQAAGARGCPRTASRLPRRGLRGHRRADRRLSCARPAHPIAAARLAPSRRYRLGD